jgi:hypothetical protein
VRARIVRGVVYKRTGTMGGAVCGIPHVVRDNRRSEINWAGKLGTYPTSNKTHICWVCIEIFDQIILFSTQHVRREPLLHFHLFLAHLEHYSVFYSRFGEGGYKFEDLDFFSVLCARSILSLSLS